MAKTFYMMRHGQTLFNVRRKIQGWCDSPLTEKGVRQAELAAKFFDDIELDKLYSSTTERASDTAEIVTRYRMPLTRVKGLKEMNFGVFEGESEDLHPDYEARETHYLQFGGESRQQLKDRVLNACIEIMEQEGNDTVLAVSHSGACKHFLSLWHDLDDVLKGVIPNCCVFKYAYENKTFKLVEIFDVIKGTAEENN